MREIYVADDGKKFDSIDECKAYEETLKKNVENAKSQAYEDKLKLELCNIRVYTVTFADGTSKDIIVHACQNFKSIADMMCYDLYGNPHKFKEDVNNSADVVNKWLLAPVPPSNVIKRLKDGHSSIFMETKDVSVPLANFTDFVGAKDWARAIPTANGYTIIRNSRTNNRNSRNSDDYHQVIKHCMDDVIDFLDALIG